MRKELNLDKYTQHGKLWRHVGAGPAVSEYCNDCGDNLYNKQAKFPFEGGWICKHCKVKKQHGVVDPKTCFQGSVITLED